MPEGAPLELWLAEHARGCVRFVVLPTPLAEAHRLAAAADDDDEETAAVAGQTSPKHSPCSYHRHQSHRCRRGRGLGTRLLGHRTGEGLSSTQRTRQAASGGGARNKHRVGSSNSWRRTK